MEREQRRNVAEVRGLMKYRDLMMMVEDIELGLSARDSWFGELTFNPLSLLKPHSTLTLTLQYTLAPTRPGCGWVGPDGLRFTPVHPVQYSTVGRHGFLMNTEAGVVQFMSTYLQYPQHQTLKTMTS